jgi:hypothetical protein
MKYYNITKLENSEKNKKNRERTDVYGCTGIGGGYTRNALQRSFDSLLTALIMAI